MTTTEITQIQTVAEKLDAADQRREQGNWVIACGGTEQPFVTCAGYRVQYLYQPNTGRHSYIDLGTDILVDDADLVHYGLMG